MTVIWFNSKLRYGSLILSDEYTNDKHDCISVLVLAYELFTAVASAATYDGQESEHIIVC